MTHLHVPGAQLEISHEHVVSGVAREGRGVGCGCLWWDDWSRELRGVFCGDLSGDAPERLPWLLRRQWGRARTPGDMGFLEWERLFGGPLQVQIIRKPLVL